MYSSWLAVDVDAGVAVAVGDVDVAVAGAGRRGCGAVEGFAAPAGRRVIALTKFPDLLAVGAELLDGVDSVVGGQHGVVVADVESVGAVVAEQALAEGAHIVAVAVEDHDGLLAASQHEDVVVGVAGHAGAFLEIHAVGQLGPIFDEFVSKVTYAVNFWHFIHPFVADLPDRAGLLEFAHAEGGGQG